MCIKIFTIFNVTNLFQAVSMKYSEMKKYLYLNIFAAALFIIRNFRTAYTSTGIKLIW